MTPTAIEQAKSIRDQADKDSCALRIAVKGGGCSGFTYVMQFDLATDADQVFSFDGLQVIIDNRSLVYLKGTTVDFKGGLNGTGFAFVNPNAKKTCGCGSSFGA